MTEPELEAYRKYHTQKALDNLREYLKNNSDEQKRTKGLLYDDGKLKEAELLERFIDGSYEGRPRKQRLIFIPSSWKCFSIRSSLFVVSFVICFGCVLLYPSVILRMEFSFRQLIERIWSVNF